MGADAETNTQTLGRGIQIGGRFLIPSLEAQKLHGRRGKRIVRAREIKDTKRTWPQISNK